MEKGIGDTKLVMNKFEEKNNDQKEEILLFGEENGDKIRMLGTYMSTHELTKQRGKRVPFTTPDTSNPRHVKPQTHQTPDTSNLRQRI